MRFRVIALIVAGMSVPLVACGGGGDPFVGGSVEEFCAEIERLEAMPETEDPLEGLQALAGLVDKAPSKEIRQALSTLVDVVSSFGDVDENDPDAFGAFFALLLNPEVVKAGETLDAFGEKECGFEPDSGSGFTDADDDPDFSGNDGSSIFDDVSAGDLSDAVTAHLESTGSGYFVSSSSLSAAGDHTLVEVTLSGEGDLDAVEVCLAADSWLRLQSEDDKIALSISLEGSAEALAGYELGGFCGPA